LLEKQLFHKTLSDWALDCYGSTGLQFCSLYAKLPQPGDIEATFAVFRVKLPSIIMGVGSGEQRAVDFHT